ncbi:Putative integral membrane protein [Chondromyces apiculatus DSM 436]|uniref:Putative integral membrane protein n=1 Tax=Chondromyces apiculatus DSM 436 TaxID=1192034 RepID=A0A017T378_9BACT|nr:Putative integral membrane protein [Chondromyces apiculatus DSM 436]
MLLAAVAIFILGPLGGIAAAYMNFSLGFFVGGQVLAGILGSAVTYGYGPEGKHGANYMQTMAASVASLSAMAVLIQAMVWMKMPMPPVGPLVLFFCCIGMFGVGLGMLYTPILVDRLKLEYPSGHAVANILRALTDKRLLKNSIKQLGGGVGLGALFAFMVEKVKVVGATGISGATIGAGMVVGSRIAGAGLTMGLIGWAITPYLVSIGWLQEGEPFRKIGFLIALAMILGAALVDLTLIGVEASRRLRTVAAERAAQPEEPAWKQVNMGRLLAWVAFWGVSLVLVATKLLGQPLGFILFAVVLSAVFVLINGISCGISDSNPISSAFVISVLLMSGLGLKDPTVGLMAAAILLASCSTGVDMQQDRSTGWRLGTNRVIQFRFQVVGIVMGAVLCVVLANVFMKAYPVLTIDTFAHPEAKVDQWQSAMTFKFVGALRDLGNLPPYKVTALGIGLGIGLVTEVVRKVLHKSARYKAFTHGSKGGFVTGWVMDTVLLPSPYASSFGGFVELAVAAWFAAGGALSSAINTLTEKPEKVLAAEGGSAEGEAKEQMADAAGPKEKVEEDALPEDMSSTSLVGGGLIAGEALFALAMGIYGLVALVK